MVVISWHVTHEFHPRPIELCGRFDDEAHFKRVLAVDAYRGWKMRGRYNVLKVEPAPTPEASSR